jgi:hypothetical protein
MGSEEKGNRFNVLLLKYRRLQSENSELRGLLKYRRRMQFSQKVCVFGLALAALAWLAHFLLLWNGREGMSDITTAIISIFGGFATCGYFVLSGVRDCSRNKHGERKHRTPPN